jgi:murein L,D-transpeptidase YafK
VALNRKFLIGTAAIACVSTFLVWDFLQIGRKSPELAPIEERATRLEIDKAARQLKLFRGDELLKTYRVSLGSSPVGHKSQEGDGRTPEGTYAIDFKNSRSRFHLALRISYPNVTDREAARRRGASPGGDIMIHGLPNGLSWLNSLHLNRDWTDGCIAVTNSEVDEIWRLVAANTPVTILP